MVASTGQRGVIALHDLAMNISNPEQVVDKCPIGYCLRAEAYAVTADGTVRLKALQGKSHVA